MLQEQIINEINHIPNDKLSELYDLIHYFRLGLLYEQQELNAKKTYPLRGVKIRPD
jgi:ribosomal protein S3AE